MPNFISKEDLQVLENNIFLYLREEISKRIEALHDKMVVISSQETTVSSSKNAFAVLKNFVSSVEYSLKNCNFPAALLSAPLVALYQ